ncbi:hypothetical protein VKT23_010229 [Stygiomarasmius scandens]|uniref:Peptidase A2 domain-containing protein n=1 Tax=Marasmiellus scandens TaxID=2682957 RepID=A0ABR1JGH9_9AGAR
MARRSPRRVGVEIPRQAVTLSGEECQCPTECSNSHALHVLSAPDEIDVIDLYSVWPKEDEETVPFIHTVEFVGKDKELINVKALFDDGAMVSAMSTAVFEQVKHKLTDWGPSARRLRMANGTVVPSVAVWKGVVNLGGVTARGEFEVFSSDGKWDFLFGKPLLKCFHAYHGYDKDT